MTKPLALNLPLQGRQWIEASAGTGKTFTLTLLVLRLLLEREIPLANILAVTFTKAATEELKIKIRAQIKLAQDLLQPDAMKQPENLEKSKQATASLLLSLRLQKPEQTLRHLLAVAMQDCDRASIFTIHGFCARILSDHALSAGQVLQAPELLSNTGALNTKLAYDIWREFGNDRDLMQSLSRLWPTPELLAKQSDSLLNAENLRPALSDVQLVDFDMQALHLGLRVAVEMHLQSAKDIMSATLQSGILHKSHMTQNIIDTAFDNLENWHSINAMDSSVEYDFSRISRSYIESKVTMANKASTPTSPLFEAIESWQQGFEQMQTLQEARDIHCLHKVRDKLKQRRNELLQIRQQYSYDDLISQVVRALAGESGAELCQALRKDYPVALVDEFQDTDNQQWKIFSSLYPEHLETHALYLIGDPKQSIYGFRGGDVHAYLAAKGESDQQWQLPENFRSRPGLLGAIATVFEQGGDNAFR
ncbi:MAG: UvrD-helicase domain-containing protein, partial [Arenimonas sp.]